MTREYLIDELRKVTEAYGLDQELCNAKTVEFTHIFAGLGGYNTMFGTVPLFISWLTYLLLDGYQ